jgi:hypothetical protein
MRARGVAGVIAVAALLSLAGAYGVAVLLRSSAGGNDEIGLCSGEITLVNVTYGGNQSGFLTLSYYPLPDYCVLTTVPVGGTFSTIVYLHSTDYGNSHTVSSVGIVPPFTLRSITPSPPVTIAAGGNESFNVTLQVPLAAGSYSPGATVTVV